MQIGNQVGSPQSTSLTREVAPQRPTRSLEELSQLPLESLTPEQRAQMRTYLSDAGQDAARLRQLTPEVIPGLDRREHQEMQRGYKTLNGGGNVLNLLSENQGLAEKIASFVERSKRKEVVPTPPPPPPAQQAEAPAQAFLDNFERWDGNQDGFLDRDELGRALQDPSMTPELGAAFAVIYERVTSPRKDRENPANSEVDLLADGKLSREEVAGITGKNGAYQRALAKIQNSPERAFIGPPDGDSVVQGRHGSCAFLAALIAMAESDPAAIQRMIRDNGDGSWDVTFPGREPVKVTLSAAERALGATSDAQGGQNGLWVAILEKAYAITQAGADSSNPLSVYDNGENARTTSEVLSGQDIEKIQLGQDGGGLGQLLLQGRVREAISRALLEGRPVTCALFNAENPWGLPISHAYTVLNIRGDNLTVRNPWGDNASGEGRPNEDANWQPDGQADGRITVSLSEFIRYFSEVNC